MSDAVKARSASCTAGVVYLLISPELDISVLLVLQKQRKKPLSGGQYHEQQPAWVIPGGGVDLGIDHGPEEAATREFMEETGRYLEPRILSQGCLLVEQMSSFARETDLHLRHTYLVLRGVEPPQLPGETKDLGEIAASRFFPLKQLPTGREKESLGVSMHRGHRRRLAALLRHCAAYLAQNGLDAERLAREVELSDWRA